MRPSWPCVHVWALQRVSEHGYEWENVAYVCSAPQLFAAIFIWGGQALTRHTNTHLRLSGLRRGLQRPGPVILTRTHIWTLLPALHYSAAHAINTLNCDYTGNYEKHFNRSARGTRSTGPVWNEILKYSCFFVEGRHLLWLWRRTPKHTYWSQLFLTGRDSGLAPPQMEESK